MSAILRFFAALLAAAAFMPAMCWLTLSALSLLGLGESLHSAQHWLRFCLCISLACAVPPFVRAWPDRFEWRFALKEGARAVLFSFSLFIIGLLAFFRPLLAFLSIPPIMAPILAGTFGPVLACPLFLASFLIAHHLMPLGSSDGPAPRSLLAFRLLSLAGLAVFAAHILTAEHEVMILGSRTAMSFAAWAALVLRHAVLLGDAGAAYAWIALSTCLSVLLVLSMAWRTGMDAAAILAAFLLVAGCCAILFNKRCREWLR
ncbi:MAG: hypothetical protein J6I40_01740 [Mailhella sp.]|nr:hypothetical protein [Mailhella sp.]